MRCSCGHAARSSLSLSSAGASSRAPCSEASPQPSPRCDLAPWHSESPQTGRAKRTSCLQHPRRPPVCGGAGGLVNPSGLVERQQSLSAQVINSSSSSCPGMMSGSCSLPFCFPPLCSLRTSCFFSYVWSSSSHLGAFTPGEELDFDPGRALDVGSFMPALRFGANCSI